MSLKELEKQYIKDPKSRIFFPLAEEYAKAGELDMAVDILRKGLIIHPSYVGARVSLAKILIQLGQNKDARKELEQVIGLVPDNIMAHTILGKIYEDEGLVEKALERFKLVLVLNPDNEEIQSRIEQLEISIKKVEKPKPVEIQDPHEIKITKEESKEEQPSTDNGIDFELPEEKPAKEYIETPPPKMEFEMANGDISFDLPDNENLEKNNQETEETHVPKEEEEFQVQPDLMDEPPEPIAEKPVLEEPIENTFSNQNNFFTEGSQGDIQFDLENENNDTNEPIVVDQPVAEPEPPSNIRENLSNKVSFDIPDPGTAGEDILPVEKDEDILPVSESEEDTSSPRTIKKEEIQTVSIAKVYLKQGYYNRAKEILNEILKTDPVNNEAKILLEEIKEQAEETVSTEEKEIGDMPWRETIDDSTREKQLEILISYLKTVSRIKKERGLAVREETG